jgi:hypothetical protein
VIDSTLGVFGVWGGATSAAIAVLNFGVTGLRDMNDECRFGGRTGEDGASSSSRCESPSSDVASLNTGELMRESDRWVSRCVFFRGCKGIVIEPSSSGTTAATSVLIGDGGGGGGGGTLFALRGTGGFVFAFASANRNILAASLGALRTLWLLDIFGFLNNGCVVFVCN